MILFGEKHLRRVVDEHVRQFDHARNPQGIGNELIDGEVGVGMGPVDCMGD